MTKPNTEIWYRMPEAKMAFKCTLEEKGSIGLQNLKQVDGRAFVLAPFNPEQEVLHFTVQEETQFAINSANNTTKVFRNLEFDIHLEESDYKQWVLNALDSIEKGEIQKVVMAQKIIVSCTQKEIQLLFDKLCLKYPHAFVYLLFSEDEVWIGASPEMLLSYDDGQGKTMALAGTKDRASETWGQKEKEEQQFISTYIEEVFGGVNGLDYRLKDTKTIRAGAIEHISTLYEFTCSEDELYELIPRLHPTPAVCGSPKDLSAQLIEQVEGFDRSYYAGFLGFIDEGSCDLFVNLRCGKWDKDVLTLFAGAGITKDSNPKQEWLEVNKKWNTLLSC